MNIRILPEIISNKIAAGEVVERPASVVKELVENALDAGSTQIIIEVEKGGKSLIRVSDNGAGMSRDDALLSIERYATSKIFKDEDLFCISTFGFRGEALPSIASVSRFTLVTKEKNAQSGTEIKIEGGKVLSVSEKGSPAGTMITVKDLFVNTPARRKFMKSTDTELGHIADTVASMALGHTDVRFRLLHNGKTVYNLLSAPDSAGRAEDILGKDTRSGLYRLGFSTGDISVSGWISSPLIKRSTARGIYTYVNGRFVRDKVVQHALFKGYEARLIKGEFPVAVIFIKLPYDSVDVNVHPAKREVRFADRNRVHEAVRTAVKNALDLIDPYKRSAYFNSDPLHLSPSPMSPPARGGDYTYVSDPLSRNNAASLLRPIVGEDITPFSSPQKIGSQTPVSHPSAEGNHISVAPSPSGDNQTSISPLLAGGNQTYVAPPLTAGNKTSVSPPLAGGDKGEGEKRTPDIQSTLWTKKQFRDLRILGQLHGTYIICESDEGIFLIDQHATHERILYEQLKHRREGTIRQAVQKLLMPEIIETGYREAGILEKLLPDFHKAGIEIEAFGGNTFIVKSVPPFLADKEVKGIIIEIMEKIIETGFAPGLERASDEVLKLVACHGAIRANQQLSDREIRTLVDQLDGCEMPSHCPHGRPTWISFTIKDLEKLFKRTG